LPGAPPPALRRHTREGGDVPLPPRRRPPPREGEDEIVLHPGEQFTIPPDTLHWFQAGDDGAVVSEFSTQSRDDLDVFTDPRVVR
jgi:D-lyxose ketol-isomerase